MDLYTLNKFESAYAVLARQWSKTPIWALVLFNLPPIVAGYLGRMVVERYRGWLRMGPGGAPFNFLGYVLTGLLESIFGSSNTKSLEVYDRPEKYCKGWSQASEGEKANAQKSFLGDPLPERKGPQAQALPYNIPQRQREFGEYVDPELKEAYTNALNSLASKYGSATEWKTSVLEKRGRAMFVNDTFSHPTPVAACRGEVGHVHESDISGHVALSLADAKEVVAMGWGERHRMSGSKIIPLGYTMVYQPRRVEEVDYFVRIFEAGIQYGMSNGSGNGKVG